MVSNEELQRFTLDWCNEIVRNAIARAQQMSHHRTMFEVPRIDRLSAGVTGDSSRCVIAMTFANALGVPSQVSDHTRMWMLGRQRDSWVYDHPEYVNEFINRFDNRDMPELDVQSEEYRWRQYEMERRRKMFEEQQKVDHYRTIYKGIPQEYKWMDVCDIPVEPLKPIDWAKELKIEGVAETETP